MKVFNENNYEDINFTIDSIYKAVICSLDEQCNIDLWNEETSKSMERLEKLIDINPYISHEIKVKMDNLIIDIAAEASSSAFEKGLKMGLSLLKNIINAELPIIHYAVNVPKKKKPEPNVMEVIPMEQKDKQLIKYINNCIPLMSEMDKGRLIGHIQNIMSN